MTEELSKKSRNSLIESAQASTRRRISRLVKQSDRDAVVVAHALARSMGALILGVPFGSVRILHRCPSCGSAGHGRPSLVARGGMTCEISLTHTDGLAAAGASAVSPIGIDAEKIRDRLDWLSLGADAFSSAELKMLTADATGRVGTMYWVRKEAALKATRGVRLADFGTLCTADIESHGLIAVGAARLAVLDLPTMPSHVAAVAAREVRAVEVIKLDADALTS